MTEKQLAEIVSAIRSISHGGTSGPLGLEGLTMAVADITGSGKDTLADAIRSISASLDDLAEAYRERTEVIEKQGGRSE